MKKLILIIAATMLVAVEMQGQHIGCMRTDNLTRASDYYLLPEPYKFDPQKTYHVPVVLFSFSDNDFSMSNPVAYYNRIFNETGFNNGMGRGCVADYFRDQSGGRVNLVFDIYGPVKIKEKAWTKIAYRSGVTEISQALDGLSTVTQADFSIYDWDGKGEANIVLFLAAGYCGNQKSGYLYPNTGYFFKQLPGDIDIYISSLSCELWKDDELCGIGTIIHEFCHFLGLPDIYPTVKNDNYFTVVDQWDLMDGGNYVNYGWCPPNLTAMERMYLGWASPEELTEATTIEGMKSLEEGGKTYIVRDSDNGDEFYLLENRQQMGWDYGCPGNGLLIYHIDFKMDDWRNNQVNIRSNHFGYDLFHADGKTYNVWDPKGGGIDACEWAMKGHLRSNFLSTTPYPYTDPVSLVVNNRLTDDSSPAATLFPKSNVSPPRFMGKAITNIRMADDGTIAFDFMKSDEMGIAPIATSDEANGVWYTIDGRRLPRKPTAKGMYILKGKGKMIF